MENLYPGEYVGLRSPMLFLCKRNAGRKKELQLVLSIVAGGGDKHSIMVYPPVTREICQIPGKAPIPTVLPSRLSGFCEERPK